MKLSNKQTNYVSDFDKFLHQLKRDNPHIEEGQRAGRAIHWDKKPVSLEEQARDRAARLRQQPYVYQSKA